MPRSGQIKKRKINADIVYGSKVLEKLINRTMKDGKKSVARREIYHAFDLIKQKSNLDSIQVFNKAIDNVKPLMEVRSRRVGGAAYQVPMPVRGERRESLAIRWIILAAKARPSKEYHTFAEKLSAELLDASNNIGGSVKKREDTQRMAEANKAFAHFRW